MKKLIYISILLIMVFFTSCFEDIDNWYSNTSSYDGRYVVAKTCEEYSSDNTTVEDGDEVMIYNSAANTENEIIVDCDIAGLPVKGKFNVTGNSSDFSANDDVENISRTELGNTDFYIIYQGNYYRPSSLGTPDGAGEEYDGLQIYARLSIVSGKVIPNGATTIGGNVSDSVYLKVTAYCDNLIVESYELPKVNWANQEVPEYAWRIKAGSRTNADGMEEHWTLSGYRYTGFPEDDPSTTPPIIEN